jgi:preprotein translocase subunit SecE
MEEVKKRVGPIQYLKESKEELEKVTWPNRKETMRYTILVVGMSLALGVFIGALDFVLNIGLDELINLVS